MLCIRWLLSMFTNNTSKHLDAPHMGATTEWKHPAALAGPLGSPHSHGGTERNLRGCPGAAQCCTEGFSSTSVGNCVAQSQRTGGAFLYPRQASGQPPCSSTAPVHVLTTSMVGFVLYKVPVHKNLSWWFSAQENVFDNHECCLSRGAVILQSVLQAFSLLSSVAFCLHLQTGQTRLCSWVLTMCLESRKPLQLTLRSRGLTAHPANRWINSLPVVLSVHLCVSAIDFIPTTCNYTKRQTTEPLKCAVKCQRWCLTRLWKLKKKGKNIFHTPWCLAPVLLNFPRAYQGIKENSD